MLLLVLPSSRPEHVPGLAIARVASRRDNPLVSVPHSPLPDERPQVITVHKLIIPVGHLGSASPPSPTMGMAPVSQSVQSHDGHGSSQPVSPVARWARLDWLNTRFGRCVHLPLLAV